MEVEKKPYIPPQLTIHGTVQRITKGNTDGSFTDKDFPVKTPKKQLTFSGPVDP